MIIEMDNGLYELKNEEVNKKFTEAKKYLINMLDDFEKQGVKEQDLYIYLMSIQCQITHIINKSMEREGQAKFLESLGAVLIHQDTETE